MKILFKYATRSRPENFKRGLDSIIDNCESKNYKILISQDYDDETIFDSDSMANKYRADIENIVYCFGESKSKIDAINRDVNECNYDWDVLINFSDDMVFTQKGFDNVIRESFDNLDQYIHFNDGNQKANVSTMHIVGRDYYNRFKYIYNPEYVSLWADVENDIVAKALGCYKYMGDDCQIFKHLHPAFGLAPTDEQYQRTEAPEMWAKDEATFNRRKICNFQS